MTARRWANQDTYAAIIDAAADRYGIPRAWAYGLIAQESGFNANAYRSEPQIGDGSYGLTQVLYRTAQGLGFTGQAAQLFTPAVNVPLGLKYLREQLDRADDILGALSAYNGGWRPASGYGRRLADGNFRNQSYVDGVQGKAAYFEQYFAEQGAPPASPPPSAPTEAGGGFLGFLLAGGLLASLLNRFKRRKFPYVTH